jgi:uncharacterized protein (TIGR03118 family)
MKRRDFLAASGSAALVATSLAACGGDGKDTNSYVQTNLVADTASAATFKPALTGVVQGSEFIDAWGIAIRPAGAGGHFWVGAGGYSYQFVGDVQASSDTALRPLFQDALAIVKVPGAGLGAGVAAGETDATHTDKFEGFTTGVVFNGSPLSGNAFAVANQTVEVDGVQRTLAGPARFIFSTDSGVISGWTERDATSGSTVRRNGAAVATIDNREAGHAYFGLAIKPDTWDVLWAADFGAQPQLRAWDAAWQPLSLAGKFTNPFLGTRTLAVPGDYAPFNVQVLAYGGVPYVFVAYAKTQAQANNPALFDAGEEDALPAASEGDRPNRGKVAMFSTAGALVRVFNDDGRLNAPWGLAVAPANFGRLSGALLVGNFGGAGRIAAFDVASGNFIDHLRQPSGQRVEIAGLWGLQFGNGASLGDSNALYFAAGPADETQGLFGALRAVD